MHKLAIKYNDNQEFITLINNLYKTGYYLIERSTSGFDENGEKLSLSEFKDLISSVDENNLPEHFYEGYIVLENENEEISFFSKDFKEELDNKYYSDVVKDLIDRKKVYEYDGDWKSELTKKITINFKQNKNVS